MAKPRAEPTAHTGRLQCRNVEQELPICRRRFGRPSEAVSLTITPLGGGVQVGLHVPADHFDSLSIEPGFVGFDTLVELPRLSFLLT